MNNFDVKLFFTHKMDFNDLPYEDIIQYLEWHDQPVPEDQNEAYNAAYELLAYTEENIPESILDWYNHNVSQNWEYSDWDEEEEEKVIAINRLEMLPDEVSSIILRNLNCRDLIAMRKSSSKINNLIETSDLFTQAIKNLGFVFDLTKISSDRICKLFRLLSEAKPGLAYIIGKNNPDNFHITMGTPDLLSYTRFINISATKSYCLLLDRTGSVYEYRRQGLTKIPYLSGIIDISTSTNYNLLVNIRGDVLNWEEKGISNIKSVSISGDHKLFLSIDGKVYGYGHNEYGQLGLNKVNVECRGGQLVKHCFFPELIPRLPKIKAIQTGFQYSLFLSTTGTVYGCGSNILGQLGIVGDEKIFHPIPIPRLKDIISISAKHNHSLFLTGNGKVYGCGDNSHGQLGISGQTIITVPTLIPRLPHKITKIFAGFNNSFFLTPEGQLYQCGSKYDDENQIEPPHAVFKMSDVISVSDAEGCTLFLKEN